jgi:hypothetical protein
MVNVTRTSHSLCGAVDCALERNSNLRLPFPGYDFRPVARLCAGVMDDTRYHRRVALAAFVAPNSVWHGLSTEWRCEAQDTARLLWADHMRLCADFQHRIHVIVRADLARVLARSGDLERGPMVPRLRGSIEIDLDRLSLTVQG